MSQLLTSLLTVVGVRHDDVRDLAAAGADRAGHDPAVDRRHASYRASARRATSSPSGRHTGQLNSHIEESFTGHELVKVFGRRARSRQAFAEHNDALYQRQLRRAVRLRPDHAGDDVPRKPELRAVAVVGGLRVASGSITLGDVQAFIQYSRQFTQPLTQVASMANLLAVRGRLGRAGLRPARRRRADP